MTNTAVRELRRDTRSAIHLLSAMSAHTNLLLFISLWASMQDGLSLPVNKQLREEAADRIPTPRTRRCACSSLLDSECHYFCHLDIIWVNTPSKTTVYGLGSALSRHRRSTGRCSCAKPDDQSCTNFCSHSPEIKSQKRRLLSKSLRILRALASSAKKTAQSHRGGSPEVQSLKTKR